MAKQPVRVHIFNQTYTVLVDGDAAPLQAIAQELDELMTMIAARAGSGDSARVAVLACLHLADKLKTAEGRIKELEGASGRVAALLDQLLQA